MKLWELYDPDRQSKEEVAKAGAIQSLGGLPTGKKNFVIFDPKNIEIMERPGKNALLSPGYKGVVDTKKFRGNEWNLKTSNY